MAGVPVPPAPASFASYLVGLLVMIGLLGTFLGLFETLAGVIRELDPDGIPVPLLQIGVTDGRFFSRLGIQTYGFLPMRLPESFRFTKLIHAADERIPVDALEFGAEAVWRAVRRFG